MQCVSGAMSDYLSFIIMYAEDHRLRDKISGLKYDR